MMFANHRALWLMLGTMLLLLVFLWSAWRKKQSLIRQFVHSRLFEQLTYGVSTKLQISRMVLVAAAVAFLFLAMARPQWGFTWEEATQRGRDIVVAIDTSKSMLARDIAPNRLERAKLAALDLLNASKNDRLGLVTFAGTAFLQCPLTLDDEAFRQSVQILQPDIIPQGGTAIGEAIDAALSAFKDEEGGNHKVIVLLTDGEDHEEFAMTQVDKAASLGVKIFTVGVGTANGELLKVLDERGREAYLKDDLGNVVKSRLNEKLLQQIATTARGFYLPLQGAGTMEKLYETGLAPLPTSEANSTLYKQYKEQFFWPLAIGLLLLAAELFVPERKRMKNQNSVPKGQSGTSSKKEAAAALIFLVFVFGSGLANASPSRAMKNYGEGNYKDALKDYKRSLEKKPDDPRLHYNAGAAAYQAKQYGEASREFNSSLLSPDLTLQQKAYYNLGNTEFRLGESEADPAKKKEAWQQSLKHFESSLKLNPNDADAEFNRSFVQKMIEQLEQMQKQQQKQKGDNKDNKDDKDQKDQEKQEQNEQNKDQPQKNQQDNKDQQKEDQKSEQQDNKEKQDEKDQKDGQQQSSNDQKKEGEGEQQKDQQSARNEQEKKNQEQANKGKEDEQDQEGSEAQQQALSAALGKMTPAQARQLLDTQKGEEKALLFLPQKSKNAKSARFKDW